MPYKAIQEGRSYGGIAGVYWLEYPIGYGQIVMGIAREFCGGNFVEGILIMFHVEQN